MYTFLSHISDYTGDGISKFFHKYPEELEGGNWIAWLLRNPVVRFLLALFLQYLFITGCIKVAVVNNCYRKMPQIGPILDQRTQTTFFSSLVSISDSVISMLSFSTEYLPSTSEGEVVWHRTYDQLLASAGLHPADMIFIQSFKQKQIESRSKLQLEQNPICQFDSFVTRELLTCLRPKSRAEQQGCLYYATLYTSYVIGFTSGGRIKSDQFLNEVMREGSLWGLHSLTIGLLTTFGGDLVKIWWWKVDLRSSYLYLILKFGTGFFIFEFVVDYLINRHLLLPDVVVNEGEQSYLEVPLENTNLVRRLPLPARRRRGSSGGNGRGGGAAGGGGGSSEVDEELEEMLRKYGKK